MNFTIGQTIKFSDNTEIVVRAINHDVSSTWIQFEYNRKLVWGLYRQWSDRHFIESAERNEYGMKFYKRIVS